MADSPRVRCCFVSWCWSQRSHVFSFRCGASPPHWRCLCSLGEPGRYFSSAWYLSNLYGGLGQGLSAALVAIWALLLLVTVPVAVWGLVRTRGSALRLPVKATLGALVVGVLLGAAAPPKGDHESDTRAAEWSALVASKIAPLIASLPRIPTERASFSPNIAKRPTSCETSPTDSPTAFAYFRGNDAQLTARCYQAPSLAELAQQVAAGLTEVGASDLVVLDRVTSVRELVSHSPLLDPLMLRPGVDGGLHWT